MSDTESGTVVRLEAAQQILRDHFLGWQCRLRQISVRQEGGRPSEGMCPHVRLADEDASRITVLVLPADLEATADRFQHMARRTHDPAERYKAALTFLAAGYLLRQLFALFRPSAINQSTIKKIGQFQICILDIFLRNF